jgi:hypothetical protein
VRRLAIAAVLVATVGLVFGPVVGYGFVNWDDDLYITENPAVDPAQQPDSGLLLTRSLNYPVPVPIVAYRWVASVAGFDPGAFHLLNLVLHGINVLLVFLFLSRYLSVGRAAVGALLFAVHPIQAEAVAWCTSTKDLLAAGFTLASLTANDRALRGKGPPGRWLLLVVLTGALAILSKPSACVLPAALAVQAALLGSRGTRVPPERAGAGDGFPQETLAAAEADSGYSKWHPRNLLAYGALVGTAAFVAVMAVAWSVSSAAIHTSHFFTASYFSGVLQAVALQARHFLVPLDLQPFYVRWVGLPAFDVLHVTGVLVIAGLLVLAVVRFRNPDPRPRLFLALFALFYLPVSGVVPIQRFIADSYMYLPLVPLIALACVLVPERWLQGTARRTTVVAAVVVLAVLLAFQAAHQRSLWESSRTLWTPALEANPTSHVVFRHYAQAWSGPSGIERPVAVTPELVETTIREGAMDSIMVGWFAQLLPADRALALFLRQVAAGPVDLDLHRNFVTFVALRRPSLDATGLDLLGVAATALADDGLRKGDVGMLPALARLLATHGLGSVALPWLEDAGRRTGDPQFDNLARSLRDP